MKARHWNWLFVVAVIAAALAWLLSGWTGLTAYRPAYREAAVTGAPLPALAPKVVFVIIDGLRYDALEGMPCLHQLASRGASAPSTAALPSFSQPTWTNLVTGASPEISGVSLLNAEYEDIRPIQVAHLFQVAKQAGLTTALAGQLWWGKLVPAEYVDQWHLVEGFDVQGDQEAAQAAVEFAEGDANLMLLYLADHDEVSHRYGALSPQTRESAGRSDQHLCSLLAQVNLSTTVVIVTSDHGQQAVGGHGGDEHDALTSPFVMAGPRVRPGIYPGISQADIPATIAALLGTPLPTSGQGRIRYELLDVTEAERAQGLVEEVAQQVALGDAYLAAIRAHPLVGELKARATQLGTLVQAGSLAEASRSAEALLDEVRDAVGRARAAKLNQSRWLMLPAALLGLALIGWRLAANVRSAGWATLLSALVGAGACHCLYVVLGQSYSLSTLGRSGSPVAFAVGVLGGAILALGLGASLLWGLWRSGRTPSRWVESRSGRGDGRAAAWLPALSANLAGLLFAPALVAWVVSGRVGNWTLSLPGASFLLMLSLLQAAVVGFLAIIAVPVAATARRLRRTANPGA